MNATAKQVAGIVGAGLIGRAWSTVFARAGWRVKLFDSVAAQSDAALAAVAASLAEQQRHGLVHNAAEAAALVTKVDHLEDAVSGVQWVQENLPERLDVKRAVFEAMDAAADDSTVLASSTSALRTSLFTERLRGRSRCLVAHPVNPPHLVPIVEISGAPWTSDSAIERGLAVMTEVGQVPIVVKREIDGFVLNRLQGALLNEAMRLVAEGYVSPEDVDKTVAHGLGLRWSFMGPFATIELNAPGGVADYCTRYAEIYRSLAADPPGPRVWDAANVERVAAAFGKGADADERARRTDWRDRQLLALRARKLTN